MPAIKAGSLSSAIQSRVRLQQMMHMTKLQVYSEQRHTIGFSRATSFWTDAIGWGRHRASVGFTAAFATAANARHAARASSSAFRWVPRVVIMLMFCTRIVV